MNARNFHIDVARHCGDEFQRCLQCFSCAGGCPSIAAMAYRPNGIIRLVQYGFHQEIFESPDIWLCAGCRGCSIACPMAIDIPGLMGALREMALESAVDIKQNPVIGFQPDATHGRHVFTTSSR